MQFKQKLPTGKEEISKMMGLIPEELSACPHFKKIRENFKDYNFGVLKKNELIDNLKNLTKQDDYFYDGIHNAITLIKACY